MNKNKGIIGIGLILAIVLGIVVVGGGAYYLGKSGSKQAINNPENNLPNNQNQNLPVVDNSQQVNVANTTHSSSITVLSPNGGEVYKDTDKIAIKWKSTGKDRIAIYLRFSSGEWCSVADLSSSNTNYTFTPYGHDCGPGRGVISGIQKYKITLIAYKNGGMAPEPGTAFAGDYNDGNDTGFSIDSSDNYFTINSKAKTISTTNWKTYTNTECGYSFQYPDSWSQLGNESNAIDRNGVILSRLVDFMDTASQGIERSDGSNNQIYAPKDNMHIECYTMGNTVYGDELSRYNNSSDIFAQTKKTITVAGQAAIVGEMRNTATMSGGEHPGRTVIPSYNVYVFFLHKDQTRALYFEFDTPLNWNDTAEIANFEKLLTTFKFN